MLLDNRLLFYDKRGDELLQKATIEINPEVKLIKASQNYLLVMEENKRILHLINIKTQEIIRSMFIPSFSCCEHFDDKGFIIYNEDEGLKIIDITTEKKENIGIFIPREEKITCLTTFCIENSTGQYLVGFGQYNGIVQVWKLMLKKWKAEELLRYQSHSKTIKDIAFIDDERIVSGGLDKKLQLLEFGNDGKLKCDPKEFKIYLQCKGLKIDRVNREKERRKLEKIISSAIQ